MIDIKQFWIVVLEQARAGLGLRNNPGADLVCHMQIFVQINLPGAQGKVIFCSQSIVEMEVAEPVLMLHNDGFVRPSNAVIMADVKGQGKYPAFQQEGKGLLLKGSVSAAVFHTDSDIA